jgi:hypothetical protein
MEKPDLDTLVAPLTCQILRQITQNLSKSMFWRSKQHFSPGTIIDM